jgi:hypothetical protein
MASPASDVAARVCASHKQTPSHYGPRQAAYDLKKLRGKQIVRRIGHTRRYEPLPSGLRAMTACKNRSKPAPDFGRKRQVISAESGR